MTIRRHKLLLHALCLGALLLLVFLTFAPALRTPFSPFDDDLALLANPHIRSFSADNLRWMATDTSLTLRYAPLRWIPWTCLYLLQGDAPLGFHLLCLVLHLLNTVLVYALLARLLALQSPPHALPSPALTKPSFLLSAAPIALATALWALDPLRVETITWALSAQYLEATACALASLLCYVAAITRRPANPCTARSFWLALLFYTLSALFYPSALLLPVLLFFLDLRLRSTAPPSYRRILLEKLPFLLPALLIGIVTLYSRATSTASFWGALADASFSLSHRFAQACYIITYFLWKPLDIHYLSPFYGYLLDVNPTSPRMLASMFLTLALTLASVALYRRFPALLLLWVTHLVTVLPHGGYFEHPYVPGDRYTYLHDILFAFLAAWALRKLFHRTRTPLRQALLGAAVILALFLAFASRAQIRVWRSYDSIFQHVLSHLGSHPYRQQIYWQWAKWCTRDGRYAEAIDLCNKSLAIDPFNYYARAMKITVLLDAAQAEYALRGPSDRVASFHLQAAGNVDFLLEHRPDFDTFMTAAQLYHNARRPDLADDRLRAALALRPDLAPRHDAILRSWESQEFIPVSPPPSAPPPPVPSRTAPSTSTSR